MEAIIVFFRDTLSGTLYVVVSVVCSILILVCIWQLIKRNKKVKVAEEEFASSHIVMINAKGEEETVELTKPSLTPKVDTTVSSVASMSATASLHNVPVSSAVMNIASKTPTGPSDNKPVVTINPLEVAAVSSTMNVIGATSAQKTAMGTSNPESVSSSTNNTIVSNSSINTSVDVIDPTSIASTVGTTNVIDPTSVASVVGTTNVVDPASIASVVGPTNVVDPASIASTVGTTTVIGVEQNNNPSVTEQTDNQNFTN